MSEDPHELEELLDRLKACFPSAAPLQLRESADGWGELEERFGGGYAESWFDAHDGDASGRLVYEGFALLSLEQSLEARQSFAHLRRASGLSWKAHWMLIAVAQGGRAIAINDRTGAVVALSPDQPKAKVLAPSAEAFLRRIVEAAEVGAMVWDRTLGLTNARVMYDRTQHQRAEIARETTRRNRLIVILVLLVVVYLIVSRWVDYALK